MTYREYLKQLIIKECPTTEFKKLVNLIDEKTDFFTAPASTKHHLAFEGGLAIHTLGVIKNIVKMCESGMWDLDIESAIKCAFLHDLCKTGYYELQEDGTYTYNRNIKGHGDRSVKLAQSLGINLTDKEKAMIEFHMGSFAPMGTTKNVDLIQELAEAKNRLIDIGDYQELFSFNVWKHPEILAIYVCDHYSTVKEQKITKESVMEQFEEFNLTQQGKKKITTRHKGHK